MCLPGSETEEDRGEGGCRLLELPAALLLQVLRAALAASGVPVIWALSYTSRALAEACDLVLGEQETLAASAMAPLRRMPPHAPRARPLLGRVLRCLDRVRSLDLGGLHFWVLDCGLQVLLGSVCRGWQRAWRMVASADVCAQQRIASSQKVALLMSLRRVPP
jgi:hypothetical protein